MAFANLAWICCCFVLIFITSLIHHCDGVSIQPRIIYGRPAMANQYPWQVILKLRRTGDLRGGGSLISPQWVLTAAHCTDGLSWIYVKLGSNYLWSSFGVEMISNQIHQHPDYDDSTFENDVSLVKLPKSVTLTRSIQPIALVPRYYASEDFVGALAIVAGFGHVGDGFPNPFADLLFADVQIISNDECAKAYGMKIFDSTICSVGAFKNIQTFCNGDSGGPLVTCVNNKQCFQIGIISFNAKISCVAHYPGAYARITSFLDFIDETTKL